LLREVLILKGKQNIYKREYGETISLEALSPILVSLIDFLKDAREDTIQFMNIINYKIGYATDIANDLLFIFITDLTDEDQNIEEQLEIIKYEFFSRYETYLSQQVDYTFFTGFDEIVDEIFKELRPKIALIGFSGVGKTTITKLIRAEDIPMRHVPTITGDVATIKIGHVNLYLWDFAGQEKYSFVWNKFVKGADAVVLILDSTNKNVKESKFFLELVKKEEPHAKIAVVANKQDLPDALPPEEIEQILRVKTHGLIAIDPESREKMLYIIVDTLKIRSLVAPFVAPLLQRDNLVAEAEAAIMSGNIALAAEKFDQIAQLSQILEEPELATHFTTQAVLLRSKLQEMQKMTNIPEKEKIDQEKIEKLEAKEEITEKKKEKKDKKSKKEEKKLLKKEEEELLRKKKEEELLRKKKEEELRGVAEEEGRRGVAEEEGRRGVAEEEGRRGVAEEEGRRGDAEEEGRRGDAEEEERRGAAEEEGRGRAAEEEGRRGAAEEEGRGRAAEEEGRGRAAEEEGRRGAAEEEGRGRAAEEEGRRGAAEEEGRGRAAEEEGRRGVAEEEGRRRAAEEEERRKSERTRKNSSTSR